MDLIEDFLALLLTFIVCQMFLPELVEFRPEFIVLLVESFDHL